MAQVTDTGIVPKSLTEYQDAVRAAFLAVFGLGINLDAKSPEGQWVDNIAFTMSQADDALVSVGGGLNIFMAFKYQLQGIAAALGISINAATSTSVPVTLGGSPGAYITVGARAKDDAGNFFENSENIWLDAGGTSAATFTAVSKGPILVGIGELTTIVDVVPGWETITNAAEGAAGRNIESDSAYRLRYFIELFKNAVSVLDAIIAGVASADNVTAVIGEENDTGSPITIKNVEIAAHSIAIVVEGGLDEDIKDAIRLKKTGGTPTQGTTSVPDPPNRDINFYKIEEGSGYINIEVSVATTPGTSFPGNGVQLLKERIFAYINGTSEISVEEGLFELDGMQIAEELDKQRLYTPINSVPGHTVTNLELEDKAGGGDVQAITPDLIEKIRIQSLDDINITVP